MAFLRHVFGSSLDGLELCECTSRVPQTHRFYDIFQSHEVLVLDRPFYLCCFHGAVLIHSSVVECFDDIVVRQYDVVGCCCFALDCCIWPAQIQFRRYHCTFRQPQKVIQGCYHCWRTVPDQDGLFWKLVYFVCRCCIQFNIFKNQESRILVCLWASSFSWNCYCHSLNFHKQLLVAWRVCLFVFNSVCFPHMSLRFTFVTFGRCSSTCSEMGFCVSSVRSYWCSLSICRQNTTLCFQIKTSAWKSGTFTWVMIKQMYWFILFSVLLLV